VDRALRDVDGKPAAAYACGRQVKSTSFWTGTELGGWDCAGSPPAAPPAANAPDASKPEPAGEQTVALFVGVFVVAILSAGQTWAQARGQAKPDNTNPRTARFGVWDNSTNPNNVMTYEAYEKEGSKLTVSNPSDGAQSIRR